MQVTISYSCFQNILSRQNEKKNCKIVCVLDNNKKNVLKKRHEMLLLLFPWVILLSRFSC